MADSRKVRVGFGKRLKTVKLDFQGLINKIEQMRGNMTRLIDDRKKSEDLLN